MTLFGWLRVAAGARGDASLLSSDFSSREVHEATAKSREWRRLSGLSYPACGESDFMADQLAKGRSLGGSASRSWPGLHLQPAETKRIHAPFGSRDGPHSIGRRPQKRNDPTGQRPSGRRRRTKPMSASKPSRARIEIKPSKFVEID